MELRALFLGMCVVCVTLVLSIRITFHSFMVEEQSKHTHDSLKAKVKEKKIQMKLIIMNHPVTLTLRCFKIFSQTIHFCLNSKLHG